MCNLKDVNRGVNRTILQISLLLLLNVFSFRKCIRLIVKITEQNKCLFHNFYQWFSNSTNLKDLFHRLLNANTRSFLFLAFPPAPTPPPPDTLQCWYLECAESQAHTKLVCNICMWQFHRKTANIDQGQGDLSTYLPHSEIAKSYFGFERVSGFWTHSVWT